MVNSWFPLTGPQSRSLERQVYAESPALCSCPLYSHAFLKLGLLGTRCHMQLSDAVSKLAAITESTPFCTLI